MVAPRALLYTMPWHAGARMHHAPSVLYTVQAHCHARTTRPTTHDDNVIMQAHARTHHALARGLAREVLHVFAVHHLPADTGLPW